ncbi:MAG: helix-turn-helix domain-containing protein [Bacilli bacterium]|nr:helix-turn-helix domain-containing protein [Bacilli bacterium]
MDYKTGERLTKYRKKYGYSQEALADKLGVSRQAISKWETGESAPDTDNLIALAKLYNVKIDDLLNVDPEDLNNKDNKDRRDKVIINEDGIHVTSDNAEVKIDKDGIFVDGKKKEFHDHDDDDDDDEYKKANPKLRLVRKIIDGIGFGIALIVYIILGALLPNQMGWAVYWTLFFIPGIIDSIFSAVIHKKVSKFNIIFLVCFAYLFVGMRFGIWHPTWAEFILIPVFYGIAKPIENYYKEKNNDKVIDAEVNE